MTFGLRRNVLPVDRAEGCRAVAPLVAAALVGLWAVTRSRSPNRSVSGQ